jgi:putative transposase
MRQIVSQAHEGVSRWTSISPKYAIWQVIEHIKGESATHVPRVHGERKRNFADQNFWARGNFVSTVGRDEEPIRGYIRKQEEKDSQLDHSRLWY